MTKLASNTRITGITDDIYVEDKNGTDRTDELGLIVSAPYTVTTNTERFGSVGEGANYVENVEGPFEYEAGIEVRPTSLDILRLMGSYSTSSGVFTVTFDDQLPYHNQLDLQITDSDVLRLTDFKIGTAEVSVNTDEATLLVEFSNVLALSGDTVATTLSSTVTKDSLNRLDAHLEKDGTDIGQVEDFTFTVSRGIESVRDVTDAADRRDPNAIVERMKDFDFNGTIIVEDTGELDDALNGNEFSLDLVVSTDAGTEQVEFSNATFTEVDSELGDDAEDRTFAVQGHALSAKVTGDV